MPYTHCHCKNSLSSLVEHLFGEAVSGAVICITVAVLSFFFSLSLSFFFSLLLADVQQIAIDWITGNFYFLDHVSDRIFVCNQNGTVCITLIELDLSNPKAIAVDPTSG